MSKVALPLNGSAKMTWSLRVRIIFSKAWERARGADQTASGRGSRARGAGDETMTSGMRWVREGSGMEVNFVAADWG